MLHLPNYKTTWDAKSSTPVHAMLSVDGSANEERLRASGAYTARMVSAALALKPTDRVLELGCGVGRIGHELAPQIAHWEGADISANMLKVARERLAKFSNVGLTELTRSDLRSLPDASFDKAYSIAVFIHMDKEDFYLYLEDLARVLKPGGLLFFDTWNTSHPVGWRRFAVELNPFRGVDPTERKDVARNQFSNPEEVRTFLDHAGFDVVEMFSDSPWVQAVAMRRGGGDVGAERRRVQANAGRIAYSPLWTELFDYSIRSQIEGTMTLTEALEAMQDDSRGEEIPMFRAAFLDVWRYNEQAWGPIPVRLAKP
ncbi:MAG: methyltransferase domain-containing protein [Proteobacteria bacterium]|uniref:class I SAM-dependent methyltransferase n=1 Tax=Rudaea sp. TaxID=2136325 RepID=UPI001DCC20DE|nr:methyltransferase domain-containing protein [Pseudomonadota bacterium]MBS0568830.1 methyltransferase domain-containing protein [Pseudomonadota bacterium]